MSRTEKCLIWETVAEIDDPDGRDGTIVNSSRAGGYYFISGTAASMMQSPDEHVKARLTTWLIEQRRLGVECPEVTSNTIGDAERRNPLAVHERADRLLQFLESCQEHIGAWISIQVTNPAENLYGPGHTEFGGELLAHSESIKPVEVQYLVEQLEKRRFLEARQQEGHETEHTTTTDGYAYLAELRKKAIDSQQAFIAMWFDETLLEALEKGIEPGIRDAGYEPVRIDRKDHNNKIDDEIVAEIRRSRFLVADFTQGDSGARGGVYYEAGFAHGLNIPVIFTCREDAISSVHFDTRQYNHITWKTPEELRERLAKRVSATIGDGPLAKSK